MSKRVGVRVIRVRDCVKSFELNYATSGAAGFDLPAAYERSHELPAGSWTVVPTGLSMQIPRGFEGQIRSRSGLAGHKGIFVLNAPGTIDADFRGEIGIVLANFSTESFFIEPSMRIAQMVIAPVARAEFVEVSELNATQRGSGGFGSTGHKPKAGSKRPQRKSVARKKGGVKAGSQKRAKRAKV